MSNDWQLITETNLPLLDEIVWLIEGRRIWVGGRADGFEDGWLWGNAYGNFWHNGVKWRGEIEMDDDYKPTHWLRLPGLPEPGIAAADGKVNDDVEGVL